MCASSRAVSPIPEEVGAPDEPPHVLFVGRLSEEKGVLDLLEATEGIPARHRRRRAAPRRARPDACRLRPSGRARAVLRASRRGRLPLPSRGLWRGCPRGDGARPSGRRERRSAACSTRSRTASPGSSSHRAIQPRSAAALETLLADAALRGRLGSAAREAARERFSWALATRRTLDVYRDAVSCASARA